MLRRVDELLGFTIHAADGDIGRVHDLYFDDRRWAVRYLVVDTRHWLPGRRVLLSPAAVRRPDWAHHEIVASLSREQIRRCPGIDSDPPVGRRKIALSRECYTLPYYWALGGFLWTPATRALHDVRPCQAPGRCEKRDGGLAIRTSGARA